MTDIEYLRKFVYSYFKTMYNPSGNTAQYQTYYCNHPSKYHSDYGDESTYNADDIYICNFYTSTGISASSSVGVTCASSTCYSYLLNVKTGQQTGSRGNTKHAVNTKNGYSNYFSTSSSFNDANLSYDLLIDTDFYEIKTLKDKFSKYDVNYEILLQNINTNTKHDTSSSTGSSSDVSVDMTETNNILYTIGLILIVILLLTFIRKIFNRGTK